MIFWVLLFIVALFLVISVYTLILAIKYQDDGWAFGSGVSAVFCVIFCIPIGLVWNGHASDIAKVEAQHYRIQVYTERVDSLERRLSEADYPGKAAISLDADTPWATMMESLNKAETDLAYARDERARAIRSIVARKRGPMSGIVTLVGDADIEGE